MTKSLPWERSKTPFLEWFSIPLEKNPFNEIACVRGAKVPVDTMIIANHRAKNLGDLFSIRNIEKTSPPSLILPLIDWAAFFATTYDPNNFCLQTYFLRPPIKYSENFQKKSYRVFGAGR